MLAIHQKSFHHTCYIILFMTRAPSSVCYCSTALPLFASQEISHGERPLKPVTVHCNCSSKGWNDWYIWRDPSILQYEVDFTIIGHTGVEEEGQGSGVLIGVLRTFWHECFSSLTVVALGKVPSVRHGYQKGEWEAIGRIIVYGYSFAKYFPIALSPAFVASVFLWGGNFNTWVVNWIF